MKKYFLFSTLLFCCCFTSTSTAQWTTNSTLNTAISLATGDQKDVVMISDGKGGAFLTWSDYRSGMADVYAQRINALGVVQWALNGIAVCSASDDQNFPKITSDGTGGIIVTWEDNRSGNRDIYAQRLNSSGTALWTINGVLISAATGNQYFPDLIPDGLNGAIIAWYDYRLGLGHADIFSQRIDSLGVVQWMTNGVGICNATGNQFDPQLASDGTGGAIITWEDYRASDAEVYAQRIKSSGAISWIVDGVAIATGTGEQSMPRILQDSLGGAFITWQDQRTGTFNIYAQLVSSTGASQWTTNGFAITSPSAVDQLFPEITYDGFGGIVVVWQNSDDIYMQRLNATGIKQWALTGVAVCASPNGQFRPVITNTGFNDYIASWLDNRTGGANYDVYAQKMNTSGVAQWLANGVLISDANYNQEYNVMVGDSCGGAILAWQDARHISDFEVYAQNVSSGGLIGVPSICSATGIEENEGASIIQLFPNPNTGSFEITISEVSDVSITNGMGQIVLKKRLNEGTQRIILPDVSNGIYWITVSNSKKMVSQKCIISK